MTDARKPARTSETMTTAQWHGLLMDNAATCSQVIAMLSDDDGEDSPLRECVRLNVCRPMQTKIDDLVAALRWAVDYLDGWPRDSRQRECLEAARAALANATEGE